MNAHTNIEDGDDLPKAIREALCPKRKKRKRQSMYHPVIIRLIGDNGPLRIPAIRAGIYRCLGVELSDTAARSHIRDMYVKGEIDYKSRGLYELTAKGREQYNEMNQSD